MRRVLLSAFCFVLVLLRAHAQAPLPLHDGDRILFYGDSITEQRLYTTDVEMYLVTRFPHLHLRFVHAGVGGDRVTGGWAGPIDQRLARDVVPFHPTVVTVMLGMNDGGYRSFDPGLFATYSHGYDHIVASLQQQLPGVRLTLIEPSPFDDVTRPPQFAGGYNGVLRRYGQYVQQLAASRGLGFADLNTPVVDDLTRAAAFDPALAQLLIPDRVHPGPTGHWYMATALLKAWGAPAIVTSVTLDAAHSTVAQQDNTVVSDLKQDDGAWSWTQQDNALPLPLDLNDRNVALATETSDLVQALDQEPLRVTGLAAGDYQLKIDGQEVGTFPQAALAQGVNLALRNTPMLQQATGVRWSIAPHNDVHAIRLLTQVHLAQAPEATRAAGLAFLDQLEEHEAESEASAAQPKPHHYELSPTRP